jgi:AcrR family transcriptional regulator
MAPDERRAALVEATVALLREHGVAVSTRQIADAAGVAEGTIFGVFPDKASLLRAAVIRAFDPEPLERALAAIPLDWDLRRRLRQVVELLRQIFGVNERIITATRSGAADVRGSSDFFDQMQQTRRRILRGVAAVIEPGRAILRRDPDSTARLLLTLVVASVHRGFGDQGTPTGDTDSDEIVSVLLDGLLVRPPATTDTPETPDTDTPDTPCAVAVTDAAATPGAAAASGDAATLAAAATPAPHHPPGVDAGTPIRRLRT